MRSFLSCLAFGCLAVLLAAPSPLQGQEAAATGDVPQPTLANVPYGDHERQVLDFYQAKSQKPAPLLFYIHGGGWVAGDKGRVAHLEEYLAAGISVVSINYRYCTQAQLAGVEPPVKWPLSDAARALQFVRSKAGPWNIDTQRIAASGGSAGACTSLWLALHDEMADPKSPDPIARQSTRLCCAAVNGAQTTLDPQQMKEWTPNSRYGGHAFGFMPDPTDRSSRDTQFDRFLAAREKILPWIREYSPYEHVTADDPPIYLFYSRPPALGEPQQDPTHTANFGVKLQEKLRDAGVECQLVYPGAPDVQHGQIHEYLIDTLTGKLELTETDSAITIKQNGQLVLRYVKVSPPAPAGVDDVYERSGCLHPIQSPRGHAVTAMFPADHAHQHGLFSAWVNTTYDGQPVDFWNLAGRTGRVLHGRVVSTFQDSDRVGFEVELSHRAEKMGVDVLREQWKVTVHRTNGSFHQFDLETRQVGITDKPLVVNEYHYGGVAFRGPTRWLTDQDGYARRHAELVREPSGFVNDQGSDRVQGNHEHARWVALSGSIDGAPVSVALLCHADSFRAPQAARLHPTKPYFCYAPCVDGSFVIDRDHPYTARYRVLVTDARPNPEWLDSQWSSWCGG